MPSFDDFGHLFNAFKNARPWLENVRRVDLMNFTVPYSRDDVPARSRRYLSQVYGFSTPAGENDLRICPAHSDTFHLPLMRSSCVGSKEYVFVAADKLYRFTHPNPPTIALPARMDLGANALTGTTRSAAPSRSQISADSPLKQMMRSGNMSRGGSFSCLRINRQQR